MRWSTWSLVVGAVVYAASASSPAHACGGTFCDNPGAGQPPMPVDQSGENILFVMEDGWVEAHIQIQYTGDPARFAWVIPVPTTPEVKVGSQLLFTSLLNGSVPQFTLNTTFDFCASGDGSSSSSAGCGMSSDDSASASGSGGGFAGGGDTPKTEAPQVTMRDSVGNFEVVVLQPTSVDGFVDWLVQNQFAPDDDAPPVLQDYLNKGYQFVAIKLRPAANVDEIHPLVIRYPGVEPCVPLKLTAIAATEDMRVRTFFLSEYRVVPIGGYKHVVLNEARLDWANLGQNWNLAVARGVDSPVADGRAFMTEYAGTSSVISNQGLHSTSWSGTPFETVDVTSVVTTLQAQGLISCTSPASCTSPHPLVFPLLRRYLPAPASVPETSFYSCLECYANEIDLSLWNGVSFANELEELIVQPGLHAVDVLSTYPYLTRMLTAISPSEMTEDPMFLEWRNQPLEDVAPQHTATQRQRCDGNVALELSNGRAVPLPAMNIAPSLPAEMPWVERIEEFSADGTHLVLVDNTETLDQQALELQQADGWDDTPNDRWDQARSGNGDGGGCACGTSSKSTSWSLGSVLFGALALLRRRTRQNRAN